jgi:hypothetical protein
MSLINDALRRAKQAQQDPPPAPAATVPHFRPIEPNAQHAKHGLGVAVPVFLALVSLLGLLLLWELSKRETPSPHASPQPLLNAAARTLPSTESVAGSSQPQAPSRGAAESALAAANPIAANTGTGPEHNANGSSDVSNSAGVNLSPGTSEAVETNHAAAVDAASSAIPQFKLQGIVFNPQRPSALINGRVMFVGDRIRDFKVTTIRPDTVVLRGPGRTNVLSLEP